MQWHALILVALAINTNAFFQDQEADKYFDLTTRALQKALNFFKKEVYNANVDAFIGTRLVEGQLEVLRKHLIRRGWSFKRPEKLIKIEKMKILAGDLSDKGIRHIKMKNPKSIYQIEPALDKGFWAFDYPTRLIDPSLITTSLYHTREAMDEGNSDYCISEFFGRTEYNKTGEICHISHNCWILMTSPGYSRYSLTHEVFYLEIGNKFGCHLQMKTLIDYYHQKSVDDLNAGFCANIFYEAEDLSWHNYYWKHQDLFMEQAALCGILGYRDFFKSNWLNKIISWQSKNGCYKEKIPYDYPKDVWKKMKRKERYKREEKELSDGCLSHKTTVALSALVNYLRYISEDMDRQESNG